MWTLGATPNETMKNWRTLTFINGNRFSPIRTNNLQYPTSERIFILIFGKSITFFKKIKDSILNKALEVC